MGKEVAIKKKGEGKGDARRKKEADILEWFVIFWTQGVQNESSPSAVTEEERLRASERHFLRPLKSNTQKQLNIMSPTMLPTSSSLLSLGLQGLTDSKREKGGGFFSGGTGVVPCC